MKTPRVHYCLLSLLLALITGVCGCATPPEICEEQITWAPRSERVSIEKNDRILTCGDPSHPSWRKIPPRQSAAFLRTFLESKGYLDPKITVDFDTGKVLVDAGHRARVTDISAEGAVPPFWNSNPLKLFLDEPLEKTTLDQITAQTQELLKSNGYACGEVQLEAHPDGRVVLKLQPGEPRPFPNTRDVNTPEVDEEILARYEPFKIGKPFDVRKTVLAGRRMEEDSIASSVQYFPTCENGKLLSLDRAASFGPRRSWELGFGASTEEYPIAFARWKSSRLWSSASNLKIELFASNRRQNLSLGLKWFSFPADRRIYLRPGFEVEHRNERQFETIQTKLSLFAGKSWDVGDWTLEPELGASVRKLRVLDSAAPRLDTLFTPGFILGAHTHNFELYRANPRTGSDTQLTYDFLPGSQASSVAVHRIFLRGTALWNYRDYLDPRWVLGARFTYGSILTADGSLPDPARIPPDWFFLVGGDRDLRGFGRSTVPSIERGAASVATFGLESRWPDLFVFPLEPLVFFDFGWVGNGNNYLAYPVHLSPGLGFRWGTPIGTVRATFARGLVPALDVARSQFFVSFGMEF